MCGLFTYGFPVASEAFEKAGIPLYTISNYMALMEVATELGLVKKEDSDLLAQWRQDPGNWQPA
jgi:orotate phosphoribosyltransferase